MFLGLTYAQTPQKVYETKLALRDLYVHHIYWVRNLVIATKFGDKKFAEIADKKAVENARALGEAIVPFYGKEAGDKLFNLFAGHYAAIKDYLNAKSDKDKQMAVDKLNKNAEEIATFLSSANPNLPKDAVLSLLKTHGGHHIAQIDAVKAGDFEREAQVWDAMVKHIYTISDAIVDAIAKQFPNKF